MIIGGSQIIQNTLSVELAKAEDLLNAMTVCKDLDMSHMIFEIDCLVVVNKLLKDSPIVGLLKNILISIKNWQRILRCVSGDMLEDKLTLATFFGQ